MHDSRATSELLHRSEFQFQAGLALGKARREVDQDEAFLAVGFLDPASRQAITNEQQSGRQSLEQLQTFAYAAETPGS